MMLNRVILSVGCLVGISAGRFVGRSVIISLKAWKLIMVFVVAYVNAIRSAVGNKTTL